MTIARASRSRWLLMLSLAIVVTRVPLLLTGYSSDADAWFVARVGRLFWQTGQYEVSRFPGYPLHEILTGPLALLGGSFLSNAGTLAIFLVLMLVWLTFVEKHTTSPRALTILLAFTPLFWIDSAATLDYVWSLLFILLSLSAARKKNAIVAGLWVGCAIGCRPTNAIIVIPVMTLLYLRLASPRRLAVFVAVAVGSSLVSFSPVLLTYGPTGWLERTLIETSDPYLPPGQRMLFFLYRSVYSLGPLAMVGTGLVLIRGRRKLIQHVRERDPIVVPSIIGILVFLVLFGLFPLDRSYLLPAVPLVYLLLERVASPRALLAVACCIISFAFINPDVIRHALPVGSPGFNFHPGIVIEELQKRNHLQQERETITRLRIEGKAVVMVGTTELYFMDNNDAEVDTAQRWKEFNGYVVRGTQNRELHFVSGMPLRAVHSLQAEGYAIYCMDWTREKLRQWHGYDPEEEGITVITL